MNFLINLIMLLGHFDFFGYKIKANENCPCKKNVIQRDGKPNIMVKSLKLPVDHFDLSKNEAWISAYFENDQFFMPNSPIYIFIGYMFVANAKPHRFLLEGLMYELALETSGGMFCLGHRYYGPTFTHDDLRFLNSKQAIEDIHITLNHIKSKEKYKNSKVVLIGGHYGGSLAVWMKVLHPDVVDAVVASGAPLVAKVDFYEYLQDLKTIYEEQMAGLCVGLIENLFDLYEVVFKKGGDYIFDFDEDICKGVNMNIIENQQYFYYLKSQILALGAENGIAGLNDTCSNIIFTSRYLASKLDNAKGVQTRGQYDFLPKRNHACYICDFEENLKLIRQSLHSDLNKYWFYQSCTEFGYFTTTSGLKEPYNQIVPIEFFYKICSKLFGMEFHVEKLKEEVERTNELYGGLELNVTHVIFSHTQLDPWKSLGQVDIKNLPDSAFVYIRKEPQCNDLLPVGRQSSKGLRDAREKEKELIKQWLGIL